jgi:hypothetical protein
MADNYSVPPPPPAHKPVPPPPPRIGGQPASPASVPVSPMQNPVAPAAKAAPMPGPAPAARPAGAPVPMPGMPGMGPSPMEQRIQEMEKRFQDQEASKNSLENQLSEIGKQLKEEHEKVLMQSLRAKEEEALSSRVEQQIRDMQEKLRREKHEQEILESRSKAENQLKDLERRLTEERESWMVALKNQLKERELIEQDVEKNLSRRLREAEERFQEEKNEWISVMRKKEEELSQLQRQAQLSAEHLKEVTDEKDEEIEQVKEAAVEARRAYERETQTEFRALQGQLDIQIRDGSTFKAQVALLQNQLQQLENQRQEDRTRAQAQMQRQEADQQEVRKRFESQLMQREDDLKREYARRDQERTQYWENVVAQVRSEKEALRASILNREEETTRLEVDLAEARRIVEVERNHWKNDVEKVRREAQEHALQNLPESYLKRLNGEHAKWEQQHLSIVQELKEQLKQALEGQKGMAAKLSMLTQDRARLEAAQQEEQAGRESQTKQFIKRIAEMQLRESALREELQAKESEAAALRETADRTTADLEGSHAEKNELLIYRSQTEKELENLRREIKAMAQAQTEWKNTVVQLQNERDARDRDWIEKEKTWMGAKATAEKTIAHLEKANAEAAKQVSAAQAAAQSAEKIAAQAAQEAAAQPPMSTSVATVSPEAAKALTAIRQQMQEMQTLLTWLRPVKKQTFNQAA